MSLSFHLPPLLAMFGFGPTELLILAAVGLLLFGGKLPSAMRGLGRTVKEFRDGLNEVEHQVQKETV